jgi:hypothetical protein
MIQRLAIVASFLTCFAAVAVEPAADALPSIFNGTDFTGWKLPAEPHWTVKDGVIVGENGPAKKGSRLYTERSYGDVVFETDVRFSGLIDTGIMLRRPELQLQIGQSRSLKRDMTGSFYTGMYPEEARATGVEKLLKPGDWNRIRIEARGNTFTVWLNGTQVSRYTDAKYAEPAPIGLEMHANVEMRVEFRDIRAKPLAE